MKPYTPHHIPILYSQQEIELTPEQEELVNAVAESWDLEKKSNKEQWLALFNEIYEGPIKLTDVTKINMSRVCSYLIQNEYKNQDNIRKSYAIVDHEVVSVDQGDFKTSIHFKHDKLEITVIIITLVL